MHNFNFINEHTYKVILYILLSLDILVLYIYLFIGNYTNCKWKWFVWYRYELGTLPFACITYLPMFLITCLILFT